MVEFLSEELDEELEAGGWRLAFVFHLGPSTLRPKNGNHLVLGNALFDNGKPWEEFGGMRAYLADGVEIGNHKLGRVVRMK